MKHYLVISDDTALHSRVSEALGAEATELETWALADAEADGGARITAPIRGKHPDTVILGPDAVAGSFVLADRIATHWPGAALLLVSGADAATLRAAMRAGIRDILDPAEAPDVWAETIASARDSAHERLSAALLEESSAHAAEEPASQLIVVVSSKGGSGKTTIATNLAVGLATAEPRSTVIVDLDIEFGDVANALRLTPDRWLQDAVFGPARNDTMVLKTFLAEHESGLFAVCAPETPEGASGITAEHISHLLGQLAHEYRYVVVDTAPGLSEHTLAALEQATDTVYVCGLDVPSIRGLRKEFDVLTELGLRAKREHLVINNADARAGLLVADAESTLGRSADVVIPAHRSVRLSTNEGVPLVASARRGRIVKPLRQLVELIRTRRGAQQ